MESRPYRVTQGTAVPCPRVCATDAVSPTYRVGMLGNYATRSFLVMVASRSDNEID